MSRKLVLMMNKQDKSCSNCANNTSDDKCKALNRKIEDSCFAWADEKILKKRLEDILDYGKHNASHYEVDLRNKDSKYYKAKKELEQLELKLKQKKSTSLMTY
ncbi:hypothetical protein [Vallitalea guaymasensis]|uniref:Uncharacterized protein n=1 Tax=Vallitalea guaymasensis TaxID=1185412 RepID=A0A8J8M8D9_9FIRM|nr:hypothetical protein [Vallitalea guaymasensis]QUH28249.1 hypothetical protein HYG85_04685 [Vallitalea guaymasensis]